MIVSLRETAVEVIRPGVLKGKPCFARARAPDDLVSGTVAGPDARGPPAPLEQTTELGAISVVTRPQLDVRAAQPIVTFAGRKTFRDRQLHPLELAEARIDIDVAVPPVLVAPEPTDREGGRWFARDSARDPTDPAPGDVVESVTGIVANSVRHGAARIARRCLGARRRGADVAPAGRTASERRGHGKDGERGRQMRQRDLPGQGAPRFIQRLFTVNITSNTPSVITALPPDSSGTEPLKVPVARDPVVSPRVDRTNVHSV